VSRFDDLAWGVYKGEQQHRGGAMKNTLQVLSVCILCLVLPLAACGQEETGIEPEVSPSQPVIEPTPTPIPPAPTSGSSPPSSRPPQMPETEWHLVVIGDSSLGGLGEAFASRMENDVGVQVALRNHVVGGLSAGRVLRALQAEDPSLQSWGEQLGNDLRQAEVVVMFVNPLDSVDTEQPLDLKACFVSQAPASCNPETFVQYTADMKAIWAEILALRAGQPTILRATDVYNPLVSPWTEGGIFEACTECWENMSHAARLAAEAYNIPFLSRYDAFNGTNHSEDPREKAYIQADGEHPTELANQFTAELLSRMGYEPVSPPAATPVPPDAPQPVPFPLSEPGPYLVGAREFSAADASRDGREVGVRVWYPAVLPEDASKKRVIALADPDRSGAPYPLIVSSAKVGAIFAPYLVTRGFVWAGVTRIDTYAQMNEQMIDQPLDILFALDQVASNPPEELEGIIDADHAGAIGYSFDGYNALALSGARIDPAQYLAQCPNPDATTQAILSSMSAFGCGPAGAWDEFTAHAGEAITASEDGLWQPMTDARIRAVMPLAGEGWWLFGERGLAAVDRPTLILVSTRDELYPENVLIFDYLGTPDKALISFVGPDHMMIYDPEMVARMAHFAAAFFGTHLQGHKDLAWYFSEEFVSQHDDLAWGVYVDE
jgi:predicted dienelactone hydrolase